MSFFGSNIRYASQRAQLRLIVHLQRLHKLCYGGHTMHFVFLSTSYIVELFYALKLYSNHQNQWFHFTINFNPSKNDVSTIETTF